LLINCDSHLGMLYLCMKYLCLILLIFLLTGTVYSQEIVKRSNHSNSLDETFTVLKSDRKIKHGEYTAKHNNIVLAKGAYSAGIRSGYWVFYNHKGEAVQSYNYNKHELIYTDTTDARSLKYSFQDSLRENDTVRYPIKIGCVHYALIPLVFNQRQLVFNLHSELMNAGSMEFMHVFSINANGDLVKHEILATVNKVKKAFIVADKSFDDEYKKFVPAQINHKPVDCKVYMSSTVNTFTTTTIRSF